MIAGMFMLLMYFLSGIQKVQTFDSVCTGLGQKHIFRDVPLLISKVAIVLVICLELLAPLLIMNALITKKHMKYARMSVIALIVFTGFASILYHYPTGVHYYFFMKNMSIIGGLLLLLKILK